MKSKPFLLQNRSRIWLVGAILIAAALACNGGNGTTVVQNEPNENNSLPVEPEPASNNNEPDAQLPAEPPDEQPPDATTGTIHGTVEFLSSAAGMGAEPLVDTVVELAGWENIHWAKTNDQGEYSIADVPPGIHMIIPQTNVGLTSYQSVNVVAGEESIVDFSIVQAYPMTATSSINATVYVDGIPVQGAYLWIARSIAAYVSDQDGQVNFVYGSPKGSPIIVVYNDRWTIQKVPFGVVDWEIELSRVGNPPPKPKLTIIEEQEPVSIITLLPTPFILEILPGLIVQEDCISFDGGRAAVERVQGRWKIVVGDIWLLDFGDNQREAELSLKIIQHYGFNQQCFVGRPDPSMEYYLVSGESPSGAFSGEDCIGFNPSALNAEIVNGRWKITEGSHLLLDFEDQEAEARNALQIIQKYKFTNFCFVGRPDPSLIYFRQ